jgi:AsmA protein
MLPRPWKWFAITLALLAATGLALVSLPNWNALRDPLVRFVNDRTGRELHIGGDLEVRLGWPRTHIRAADITFSNPPWAHDKNMIAAHGVSAELSMLPLFRRKVVFQEVRLDRAEVALEKSSDGRKNWLLDRNQRDDRARVDIEHLAARDGRISYLDPAARTRLVAQVSTPSLGMANNAAPLSFKVNGQYRGQALVAEGTGDAVLALRDVTTPYRIAVAGRVGRTAARADGRITNLVELSAVDLGIDLRGASLAELYPLLGMVFPDTPPYTTSGRLIRRGSLWRYERFHGHIGNSDVTGTLQVETGSERPLLKATLTSRKLDVADLGPLIGGEKRGRRAAAADGRVLPATPFRIERWPRMDADVTLEARSVVRRKALPIANLSTRLRLEGAVLRLDPLALDVAGGTLAGAVKLDGRQAPIRAAADLKVRKMSFTRLFPTLDLDKTSIGEINGDIELAGAGDTVAAMLGSADGALAMVVDGGIVSRLMMETASLHLLEMLKLKLTGDESIRIRCAVADFGVKDGVMDARALVFDTDIVRIDGGGQIDLDEERLDLDIVPKSKKGSLVALRTPIRVRGSLADPEVDLDKGKLALRGLGAVALGAINPALALVPLIEANTADDSECRKLIAEAKATTQ